MENENIKQEEVVKAEAPHDELVIEPVQKELDHEKHEVNNKKLVAFKNFFTLKRIIILIVIIALIGLGFYFKSLFVAATVNGSVISRLEIVKSLEKSSGKAALESMINEKLINQEADNRKITVSEEEIKGEFDKVESQLKDQGATLDAALAENNITRDDLRKRIITQKKLEKMLSDKVNVTDAEVAQYIKDSGTTIPKEQEEVAKTSIKENLRNTKLADESQKLVDELKAKASIKYFVSY